MIDALRSDPRITRIIDVVSALKVQLPFAEEELRVVLSGISRVCLDQILSDLSSSDPDQRRIGLGHLKDHISPNVPDIGAETVDVIATQPEPIEEVAFPKEISELEELLPSVTVKAVADTQVEEQMDSVPPLLVEDLPRTRPVEAVKVVPPDVLDKVVCRARPESEVPDVKANGHEGVEAQLVELLSRATYLRAVREDLQGYVQAQTQSERAWQARKVIQELWNARKGGSAAKELLSIAAGFEDVLPATRSCFIHHLETYLIGCLVLRELKPEIERIGRQDILGDVVFLTWLMTSSVHDAGYAFELGKQMTDRLSSLYSRMGAEHLAQLYDFPSSTFSSSVWRQSVDVGSTGLDSGYSNISGTINELILKHNPPNATSVSRYLESEWNRQNHGLVGAAMLWRALLSNRKNGLSYASPELSALQTASMAVALHGLCFDNLHFIVDFASMPYAFLLLAVDELTEWNSGGGYGAFTLRSICVEPTSERKTIRMLFESQDTLDPAVLQDLRNQILCKRNRLSNLAYLPATSECSEVAIEADFQCGEALLGSITVMILQHPGRG